MKTTTHEDFSRREGLQVPTDRSFGVVFTAFFLLLGLWPLRRGGAVRWWAVAAGLAVVALVLLRPAVLHPFNVAWARLALILARIVNPIVMGLLFFLVVTPVALMFRLLRKDPLRLKLDPAACSYWLQRRPPGPAPETMANQF